jgi:hypothetical protein
VSRPRVSQGSRPSCALHSPPLTLAISHSAHLVVFVPRLYPFCLPTANSHFPLLALFHSALSLRFALLSSCSLPTRCRLKSCSESRYIPVCASSL